MLIHVVAHALRGQKPLVDPETAWWLWWRLRAGFPYALSACLLPEHFHLLTEEEDPPAAKIRLGGILSGMTRAASKRVFEPLPDPEEVASGLHLERLVRYVHLNPCRAKLTRDPLSWPWSTHRGLLGAELNPWVSDQVLGKALGRSSRGLGTWLHGYVSGDPSVDVSGTPPPVPCALSEVCNVPLDAIRRAAFAATPWSPPTIRRRLVVQLALHQGWRDTSSMAHAAGLDARTVRRIALEPSDPTLLRAAQLCLGDSRLLLPDALIRPVGRLPRR